MPRYLFFLTSIAAPAVLQETALICWAKKLISLRAEASFFSSLAARIDRSGMNLVLGSLLLAISLAASSHHFHVRPHIVTIFFMTIIYICVVRGAFKADLLGFRMGLMKEDLA